MSIRLACAIACTLGCHDDSRPVPAAAAPVVAPADAIAAADASAVVDDAGTTTPGCQPDEPRARKLRFGTFTAPLGWCWRRTEEGDDLSGILVDDKARARMHVYELAHGQTVGDACDAHRAGVRGIHDDLVQGVAVRSCEVAGGRHCFSFHGLANLCTELPEDPAFSAADLIHTLVPAPRH